MPPVDSAVYEAAVRRLAMNLGIALNGSWSGAKSPEGVEAYKLAHVAMQSLKDSEGKRYGDWRYPTFGERVLKIVMPVLLFIPWLTRPLWSGAFIKFMNPSKAEQIQYEIYNREQGYEPDESLNEAVLKAQGKA